MYDLKFDEKKCLVCPDPVCISRCQYINIGPGKARKEMIKIARGENSPILQECVTCYACEEYCTMGNHPFFLIVERQEALGVTPVPDPLIKRAVNLGVPFRGDPVIKEIGGNVINMAAFSELSHLLQGKLFEGIPLISHDGRKMFHYFCQLMYLHYARASVIKERLPGVIKTIMKHKPARVVCFHDECYGTYSSYCPSVGIDVPFIPVHFYEFLHERLLELKEMIRPVGLKVAYQRPCSSRLSPQKHRFVGEIFRLIGAREADREFIDENALCCGATVQGQKRPESRKRAAELQRKNIEDMKKAGAEVCVFNCPACFQTLSGLVAREGIKPAYMSDLCRLAIGEKPKGWEEFA